MENKIRVCAYARVSTEKDDQANSFASQVQYFTAYIDREENWELVKIYSDEGVTGTSTIKRDGFHEMIADALAGKIDLILTKEVSRFARNVLDSIGYTRKLAQHQIWVRFVLDGIDTSQPDAEFRLTMMAVLAQEESRKISERVKWGQKRQMEKGVVFGRDLLGYRVQNGQLFLVEEEGEIVRLIFHKYLREGKGAHRIARELKEAGIRPCNPDGRAKYKDDWSSTVILRILRNEKYVGDLCQKKTWTQSYLDHKKRCNRGEEDFVYIKNHHTAIAIIDRATWEATQLELARRSPSEERKARYSNRYWASGKIFCGECGGRFLHKSKKTSQGITNTWSCMNHVKAAAFREKACRMTESISDKSLKSCCLFALTLLLEEKDELIKEIQEEIAALYWDNAIEKQKNQIQSKLKSLGDKKQKLIDLRLANEITPQEFQEQKARLALAIEGAECEWMGLEASQTSREQAEKIQQIFQEVERIVHFETAELEWVFGAVLEKVIVSPGHTVEIRWKDLPTGLRMVYHSTGKLDTYRTEILRYEMV